MKSSKVILLMIVALIIVAACNNKNSDLKDIEAEYTVSGYFLPDTVTSAADSITPKDTLLHLFIEKHTEFRTEELAVKNARFIYKDKTAGIDELFFVDEEGRTISVFAKGGANIELFIEKDGQVRFAEADSLNSRISEIENQLDSISEFEATQQLDTICRKYKTEILPLLVLRDKMHLVSDSLFLRQCLGKISAEVKTDWLIKAIEQNFDRPGVKLKKNARLYPLPRLRTQIDTLYVDFKESKPNGTLLYFWGEYSKSSIDSLQMLTLLAKKYGLDKYLHTFKSKDANHRPKRLDILTVCLNAKDSAWWLESVKDVPGQHVLLQDGFSNPIIKSWNINKIPYILLIDRFSNIQDSYLWGKDLHEALKNMPNNFTVQTNGNKNNISRTSRH